MHIKDSAYMIAKGYIKLIKDTVGMDEDDEDQALDKMKEDKEAAKNQDSKKEKNNTTIKTDALLPDNRLKVPAKDTVRNTN